MSEERLHAIDDPAIYVHVRKGRGGVLKRAQPWYWVAQSARNGKTLARSSEHYTNRSDMLRTIELLFGPDVLVVLKNGDDITILRHMQ
jgi:hypothetical protein